jgi:GH3 auxin-responsive promoter
MNPFPANSLWLAGCLPSWAAFHRATRRVAETQAALLERILHSNAGTEFGLANGFSSIRSAGEYQKRVPLLDYEAYAASIERMAAGEQRILCEAPTVLFEPTGGSSGAQKLIPYNRPLQSQFQAGISAWIADLYLNHPGLLHGRAYWSVSPALQTSDRTAAGIPVGFDEDASYLGAWQSRFVRSLMAVPSEVRRIADIDAFRYVTLLFLIRARDLKLISVWNPTFLTLLIANLSEWGERLAFDLEHGICSAAMDFPQSLRSLLKPAPRRAAELRSALRAGPPPAVHARLWPALSLISCWKDANAAGPSLELASLFPQAILQGKGLLATEGFVSFPLARREGSVLAIRSHFFEFLPSDGTGACDSAHAELAHRLEKGQKYSVVITTGGGLYRYQLHDLVEVVDAIGDCPLIRFIGRRAFVSDWFGEKLNEAHVAAIFGDVFRRLDPAPSFSMLACDTGTAAPCYVLYTESSAPRATLLRVAASIEERLRENYHYAYARSLGQLAPLRVFRVRNAAATYLRAKSLSGRRAGDVKLMALDSGGGWSQVFSGCFVEEAEGRTASPTAVSGAGFPECSYQT